MKRLYSCTAENIQQRETVYTIKEEIPGIFKAFPTQKLSLKKTAENAYWWLISRGKYRIWCVYDNDTVIHTSYVVPKCVKFPFLDKASYEIGPCHTNDSYRGKGIYPAVLYDIVQKKGGVAYMIIDDTNTPSIKGVAKAGFAVMPGEIIRDKFKRFVYVTEQ